jgi:ATP-binding cassette subfamily B protein RaxB
LLVLIQVGAGAIRSWAVLHLSATLNLQWLGNVFAHLMRLPVSWFDRRHTGDVMSRFGAVQQIQKTMTTSFVEAVLDGLMVVVTLAMMIVYSGTLTTIAVAGVAAYALLRRAFFRPLREATEEAIVFDAKRSSHFLESLRGVQSIKLFNRQADRQARFMNLVVDAMNADIATRKLDLMFGVLHKLVFGVERVAVIWVGALLVLDHRFSVGMLFAFLAYRSSSRCGSRADRQGDRDQDAAPEGERLADIVLAEPEPW